MEVADVVVLLVTQEAGERLVELVEELRRHRYRWIVVVADGSPPEGGTTLERIGDRCTLLRHPTRRGRGPALRTGFRHCQLRHPDCIGVITVDADGPHAVEDVDRVAEALRGAPEDLVVGRRRIAGDPSLLLRLGNAVSRLLVHLRTGRRVADALSALRGIPRGLLPELQELRGQSFEYELNVLIAAARLGRGIRELPIHVALGDRGFSDRSNPLLDSFALWFLLLRFASSSMACALLDTLVYALLVGTGVGLAGSVFGARALSSGVNFLLNRSFVFHSDRSALVTATLYYSLVLVMAVLTYLFIEVLHGTLGVGLLPAKIIAETLLFTLSFLVQRDFIFRRDESDPEAP